MRDIREDLKERVASVTAEMDDLKKRQSLLASIQQSLFGLLEEEDRRFRDQIPSIIESTPKAIFSESATKGIYSESTPSGLYGTVTKAIGTEPAKAVKVTMGSWAGDQRKTES